MECIDSIIDVASIIMKKEEEDRISNLPDDIIHHILGFLDMKYAIQTSKLSRRWKYIWTSLPCLNFNRLTFGSMFNFGKFVENALSRRNIRAQVSELKLTFTGTADLNAAISILKYAYANNASKISMKWNPRRVFNLARWLFSSRTLKYLNLSNQPRVNNDIRVPNLIWDLPALETLYIGNIRLGDGTNKNLNLFSKCVNLKDVTLHNCSMYGLESFTIYAPRLSNLTITDFTIFPMVFNVVAPQLETLTASVITQNGTMSSAFNFLRLSTEGLSFLEKVNLTSSNGRYKKEKLIPPLLDLFSILHNAKYLILDVKIIECLSSCIDQFSNKPCPFDNLKCLKITTAHLEQNEPMPTVPAQVRNFLLENSPTATFIMDLPQAYIKAMTEENRRLKSKTKFQKQLIASLKTELRRKDQVIANQNAGIQMKNQIIVKQNAEIQVLKFNNIRMQSNVPAPPLVPKSSSSNVPRKRSSEQALKDTRPKKVSRMEGEEKQPETIAKESKTLEEKLQIRNQLIETWKTKLQKKDKFIAKQKASLQLKDEIIAKQNADIKMLKSRNILKQSSISVPPPVPNPFSSIVLHKISRDHVPNDTIPMKAGKLLEAQKQLQKAMDEKNRRLEANIQQQYQVIADLKRELHMKDQVITNQNENIQTKDQVIANQNENIQTKDQVIGNLNANIQTKDQVIGNLNADIQMKDHVIGNLYANIQMKDHVIGNLYANIHMKDYVIANQYANMHMLKSSNMHVQTDHAPPPVPRPASSNNATSSRHARIEASVSFNLHKSPAE